MLIRIPELFSDSVDDDGVHADVLLATEARNCGTGAGGFQPGNTCATGGVPGASDSDPDFPAPGETPVPADHVRLFHYTKTADITSLTSGGIDIAKARGETYGEPNLVWASASTPEINGPVVEFSVPWNDSRMYPRPSGPEDVKRFEAAGSNVMFSDSIKPAEFLAVHQPFHKLVRHIRKNEKTLRKAIDGGFDGLDPLTPAGKAAQFVKTHGRSEDCGTGAGGFKKGNTCATGNAKSDDAPESLSTAGDAMNCPPECEMLQDVDHGGDLELSVGTIEVSIQNYSNISLPESKLKESLSDEELVAVEHYTTDPTDINNHFRYNETTDVTDEERREARDALMPVDVQGIWEEQPDANKDGEVYIVSNADFLYVNEVGPVYDQFIEDTSMAKKTMDAIRDRAVDPTAVPEFDKNARYTSDPDDAGGRGVVLLPEAKPMEIDRLNESAKTLVEFAYNFPDEGPPRQVNGLDRLTLSSDYKSPEQAPVRGGDEIVKEKLDEITNKYSEADYDVDTSYIGTITAKQLLDERGLLDDVIGKKADERRQGDEEIATLAESGLNRISEMSNPSQSRMVTWRGVKGDHSEELGNAKVGDTLKEQGIFSTSADPLQAIKFASTHPGECDTIIRVLGKRGAPLEKISMIGEERELAYPDASTFRIVNIATSVTIRSEKPVYGESKVVATRIIDVVEND